MKKIQKRSLLLIVVLFSVGILLKIAILDNVGLLFTVAAGSDKPSMLYYFATERIYNISGEERVNEKILQDLEANKNKHFRDLYIHTLGVIGEYYSATYLLKTYVKYQDDKNHAIIVATVIDSMGMIGNEDLVPLLERLLSNYENHRMQVTSYAIARALYLITGKAYSYSDSSGEKINFNITNELKDARNVVKSSMGRKRTFSEMIILDKLYRAPGW